MAATLADDDATTRHLVVEKVFSFAESGDYIALHALLDEFEPRISNLANATDVDGDTPLIVASLNGALTAVNVLLARGARVNAIGCSGRTALHCAAFFGHVDTVNRLLQCDATLVAVQDTIDEIPLHKAATNGHLGVVQSLLLAMRKRRATNAIRGPPNDDAGDEIDNFVFEQLLDLPNFLGSTPLHNATQHAHLNVMEVLLNAGANLSASDVFDWSPLEMARNLMHTKQLDAIALLRQHERLRIHHDDNDNES